MSEVKEPITVEEVEQLYLQWKLTPNRDNLTPWIFGWMQSDLESPDKFKREAAQYFFQVIRDNFFK